MDAPSGSLEHAPSSIAAPPERGFDFTLHMRRLCEDICTRMSEFAHVDMSRVAIRFCQTRKAVPYGVHASLTPLRFEDGRLTCRRRGREWTLERLFDARGREMLYLLSFYLPRFLQRGWEEKVTTVIHELWHIGPNFDGDLRRHAGRCYAHSHSQREYDRQMGELAGIWLAANPPHEVSEFLRFDFQQLARARGPIFGQKIATPKLIPC